MNIRLNWPRDPCYGHQPGPLRYPCVQKQDWPHGNELFGINQICRMITNKCPAGALRRDSPENQTQEVLERRERARSLQSRPGHGNISHEWSTWSTHVQASDDEFCLGRAEQAWVSCCSTCSVPISSGNRIASRLLDSMGSFTVFFMHACDPACRHVFFIHRCAI